MTTTELINILRNNECGGISKKPREISVTINEEYYMPNPKIEISGTGDGICGPEIDLSIKSKLWIPLSEKLPEEEERVLVSLDGEVNIAYRRQSEWKEEVEFEWVIEEFPCTFADDDIEAWMPLPKPYMAESEDKK